MSTAPETSAPQKLPKPASARRSFGRRANWFVGLAAVVLVMVSAGGYLYHRHQMAAIAAAHLRLIVSGPSTLQSGVESQFTVSTTEITGDPLPAQVEMGLYSPDGKRLFSNKESTDEKGRLQFTDSGRHVAAGRRDDQIRGLESDEQGGEGRIFRAAGRRAGPLRHAAFARQAALSAGRNDFLPLADALPFRHGGRSRNSAALRDSRSQRRGGRQFARRKA